MTTSPDDSAAAIAADTSPRSDRLPLAGLLAIAMAGFITVVTETLPAGLLPRMSPDLGVSESLIGQLITVYAIGSVSTAMLLTAAMQGWRRRPVLLIAVGGFAIANTVTAISDSYALTMVVRFGAGIFAGQVWALAAGYAARMVPEHLKGRAIAVAMVGIPLALSLGVPAATYLGDIVGWRMAFGILSIFTLILIGWVRLAVPDFPGQPAGQRLSIRAVFLLPGIRPILYVTFSFVIAHTILYTYIAPFIRPAGLAGRVDLVLLVYGVTAFLGTWIAGLLVDRHLRGVVLCNIVGFAVAAIALGLWRDNIIVIYAGVVVWGVTTGGGPTLFQTASAKTAGAAADVAQSMIVTAWNSAIAIGAIVGGVLLDTVGIGFFTWVMTAILLTTLIVAWLAKRHGFPHISA
jgi:predicted MFS family arabinose efflux permease